MFYNDTNPTNGKPPASFTAAVGRKLSDGIEVTATGSQYPVKLIPLTLSQGIGTRTGSRITYAVAPGVQLIYTFKGNGVKEDIMLDHPTSAPVDLAFRLELDPMLEARVDSKGNVAIYGPNSILSNFIQTGDEKSAELILKARQHAAKDNLLYIIPVPVIIDSAGIKHKNIAHYTLEKSIITIHADSLATMPAPISIDPSIVVTTTADFMTGNNEGMISFDVDAISRAVPSGGSVANWAATTSIPTARYGHTSVAYNGYLYVIGGFSGAAYLNDVQFAPINTNGTIGTWTATTSFTTACEFHTSLAYNGYLYVIGGYNGSIYLNDVQFAPINANGTVGTWATTTGFTTGRFSHTSVAFNGYLYVIGGYNGSTYLNDVQFAPVNGNGTVGTWSTTTSFTTARIYHTSAAYNGYLYVIGGWNGSFLNDVQFAPINANGTVSAWTASTSFPTARRSHTSAIYNGYLYVIGGAGISGALNDCQFAPINASGNVGTWTASASFTTARFYHTSVAYNGYLYVLGGWTGSGYLNDTQFAPINANGNAGAWTATTSFTTARSGHTSVVYNGYLYVLGGYTSIGPVNTVQFAPINANGTIGAWTATTSFTTARYSHTSVAYNGYLYVIGGYGTSYLSDVQYALINANGTLQTWTASTSFTTARSNHTSVAYNGYLYAIGGQSGSGALNTVQFAPINTNGTIGSWTATTNFITARYAHSSVAYSGYLYVLGGYNGSAYLNDVQFAPINSNGTLSSWTATTSFTTARYGHTSVAYNGYLYVMGGSNGPYFNDVQFAPINTNGTLGSWTATTSFTTARSFHTSAIYNGYLYVIGGSNASGYLNDVQFAPVNPNGTLSAWTATTSFTTARESHTCVAYNGYLYVIGGTLGSYLNDVQFAPVNANGTLGSWTATTSFPSGRAYHTSVAYNGYLYIIGGTNGSYLNDVLFAPVNANGTIGAWTTTTSFTTARYSHTSVAYNGYLYVIGGFSGSYLNDVQFAPINANGTVGSWTATTSFTTARAYHTSVAYNGFLYVIAGYNGSASLNDVQLAPVNANGTVGTWNATTALIMTRFIHTSAVYNGYLYVLGGYNGSASLNDVQFAPINADGTIGSWTATTSFTTARYYHASASYNGFLYVLGGYSTSDLNDVQYAIINGPASRARYSKLLDMGSDQVVSHMNFSNSGAKGITNLTYTVAPSGTAVFGTRTTIPGALPGVDYVDNLDVCARYMWIHFDLDDMLVATIDNGGMNGRGNLLDFTVNYNPLEGIHSSLRAGKSSPNIQLTWGGSQNATSYNVLRCSAPPCTPVTIASLTDDSYDDPVLSDSTNYWYLIQAVNGVCVSP